MSDLISRANAIRWVKTECNPYGKPTLDYDSGLKVIEHLKKMPSELPSAETHEIRTETHGVCLISKADAIERIANDNVVGGMKRINEYRDSTEHNDYLDGISTAIATVDDLPSADAVEVDRTSEWVAVRREEYENLIADAEQKWNCTASFVAEQLDRLRNMTDEEKFEFFKRFFDIKGGDSE